MFVKRTTAGGKHYYRLVEGFRGPDGKVRHRTVVTLGGHPTPEAALNATRDEAEALRGVQSRTKAQEGRLAKLEARVEVLGRAAADFAAESFSGDLWVRKLCGFIAERMPEVASEIDAEIWLRLDRAVAEAVKKGFALPPRLQGVPVTQWPRVRQKSAEPPRSRPSGRGKAERRARLISGADVSRRAGEQEPSWSSGFVGRVAALKLRATQRGDYSGPSKVVRPDDEPALEESTES